MTTVATEAGRSHSPSNGPPVIEVQDLVKTYGRDTRAVDGISFDVGAGELFGFLGPNSAGKTTTICVLATLLRPTSGTARILEFDVERQPQHVRAGLGIAMQMATLDAYSTGRETLELAGRLHRMSSKAIRSRADELLDLIGLTGVAKKMTGTYSGCMKRSLDLASALMHRPELLILDEPTEGLDPQSRITLWEELERISASGATMLLFPLMFMSTAFVPAALMHRWMQTVNHWNPISHVIEAMRLLMITGYDWTEIGEALLSLAVIGVVLQALTLWAFHRLSR